MPEIIVKLGDRVVQKFLLFKNQKLTIGRAPENDIAIDNPAVSRKHAAVTQVNGRYILEDNQSANGTYVNGVRISKTEILDKDVITIGKHKLHFYSEVPAEAPKSPAEDHTALIGELEPAVLTVIHGKQIHQTFGLEKPEIRIGRAADNDVRLQDWLVNKYHATISRKGAIYVLKDLGSWRHTLVNGQTIDERPLRHGDEIQFGPKITMRFDLPEALASQEAGRRRPVELAQASGAAEASAAGPGVEEIVPANDMSKAIEEVFGTEEESNSFVEVFEEPEPLGEGANIISLGEERTSEEPGDAADEVAAAGREVVNGEPPMTDHQATGDYGRILSNGTDATGSLEVTRVAPSAIAPEESEPAEEPDSSLETTQSRKRRRQRRRRNEAAPQDEPETEVQSTVEIADKFDSGPVSRETSQREQVVLAPSPAESPAAEVRATATGEGTGAFQQKPGEDEHQPKNDEVQVWEQALKNPSPIIRRQAQRKLKQLTGRDYEI